jgi:hypothetical protein
MQVIPVLVGRSRMPPAEQLPPSLQFLAGKIGWEHLDEQKHFDDDVQRLIRQLSRLGKPPGRKRPWLGWFLLAAALLFLALAWRPWPGALQGIPAPWLWAAVTIAVCIGLLAALRAIGPYLPGRFAWRRLQYLRALVRSAKLREGETRFAPLELGRGPRYISAAEVRLESGQRHDLVALLTVLVSELGGSRRCRTARRAVQQLVRPLFCSGKPRKRTLAQRPHGWPRGVEQFPSARNLATSPSSCPASHRLWRYRRGRRRTAKTAATGPAPARDGGGSRPGTRRPGGSGQAALARPTGCRSCRTGAGRFRAGTRPGNFSPGAGRPSQWPCR